MKQSISNILNIRIALVLICVNMIAGTAFYFLSIHRAETDFKQSIEQQAKHLGDAFTQQLWLFDLSSAEQLATLALGSSSIKGLRLSDHNRKTLIEQGSFAEGSLVILHKQLFFQLEASVGFLELAFTDTVWRQQKRGALLVSVAMVGLTIVMTFLMVSLLLKRHLASPLRDLQQDMVAVADGQFKTSMLSSKTQEIASIISVFNKMAIALALREEQREKAEADRAELEAQLRQKYKMEAVGVMAGGMAHNFNNNLAIILGNLELSKRRVDPRSEVSEYLEHARIAVTRSRDLVQQILTYSRKDIQKKSPMPLSLLLNETVALLKSTIPTSVKLEQKVELCCDKYDILANASQIQEILLNLCNNAVHAMGEQGELTLSLESCQLQQKDISSRYNCQPGLYCCLSVQDTGYGIPADNLEKIFDPFFTTKNLYEGTGMGLATVQGIVEQHQGMISVESRVGQGTTFRLYFPVTDRATEENSEAKEVTLAKGTERILYIDDDEMLTTLNQRMLADMGYRVTVQTNSLEALKLFTATADNFDLVITDQTMPDLTGMDLIEKIRAIRPEIPTILCTGYSSKVNKEKARQSGINAFLMKPVEFSEMLQVIRQVIGDEAGE
jgi:signal transduction histidine kinase/ActR/RegA family two-component response regulator